MPRIQPLMPLLRPLAPPGTVTCRTHLRFSTATRLCAANPPQSSNRPAPSHTPPAAPEAVTESDSAQPLKPKRDLPWQQSKSVKTSEQFFDHFSSKQSASRGNSQSTLKKAPATSRTNTQNKKAQNTPKTSSAISKPTTQSAPPINLPPPKYHVARSKGKNLPIYTDRKRGGNLHQTVVRKISGDSAQLRDELIDFLQKKTDEVVVNPLTQHVIVKGHHPDVIKAFLEQRGF